MSVASSALAHPERQSHFPDPAKGSVPKYRHTATPLIVCKKNSKRLIRKVFKGRSRARTKRIRLRQLKKCRFRHIQSAVNRARTNDRIQILPGVYREEPSRKVSIDEPACAVRPALLPRLYPWSMHVKGSKFERRRIGRIATIKPGQDVPLTLSWRVAADGTEPVEVRFDGGTLALPR